MDVGGSVEGRALEGLGLADVEGDLLVLAHGCEEGGGIMGGVPGYGVRCLDMVE